MFNSELLLLVLFSAREHDFMEGRCTNIIIVIMGYYNS